MSNSNRPNVTQARRIVDAAYAAETAVKKAAERQLTGTHKREHARMCHTENGWARWCWCMAPCCWETYGKVSTIISGLSTATGRCICMGCSCRREDRLPW